jgi:hypothetical protein
MLDLLNDLDFKAAINPSAATSDNTAVVTTVLDMSDLQSALLLLSLGALADADATFAVTAKESDTGAFGGEETDVPAGLMSGTLALAGFTFADDNKLRKLGFLRGGKRYKKVTITPSGNASAAYMSAVWAVDPNQRPSSNPPA